MWQKSSRSAVKWNEVKFSDVRWNWAVGNLNGVKLHERVSKWSVDGWSLNGKKWIVDKCSADLSKRLSIIIRTYVYRSCEFRCFYGCFAYHIFSYFFGSILYRCVYGCLFCMLLFNSVSYVFLLLCYVFLLLHVRGLEL